MSWSFPIEGARKLTKRLIQLLCLCLLTIPLVQRLSAQTATNEVEIIVREIEGTVEVLRSGARTWDKAQIDQVLLAGDQIRTRERSRLALRWSDKSIIRLDELSDLQIQAPTATKARTGFSLWKGMLYFFHRDKPTQFRFNTGTASAAIRGTEFNLEAEENGPTILTMLDGEVELSNDQGRTNVLSGEQGIAEPGKPPTKTAALNTINIIQWALYYPGVLDLEELGLSAAEQQTLAESLSAYREGDLLEALAKYPADRQPASATENVYLGALLLAVGQVEKAHVLLDSPDISAAPEGRLRVLSDALTKLIDAVKLQPHPATLNTQLSTNLATAWMAESYYQQSRRDLTNALKAARSATTNSPRFGFAWARVAELEFGFGRTKQALAALDKSLELAPRNAQALALKGFLRSAQNKISEAITYFERAMAIDGALGNAWLGRGLCRIRQGKAEAGREDLLVAAALEPQRAVLRSYLGKAFSNEGDSPRAIKEIQLAKKLDEKDPTAWLYSALLNQQNNRINEAVRDLEKSQELNDNRSVYRSRLLLDQDRAVRSANLANIYRDAGMVDVSVREAVRAVNYDYGNYSAHLFLANSYDQLRDPKQINLRYETPWLSEYLLANLLAPVGAGTLSQTVSQQEYSKLFERDRFGVSSSTEYFSNGRWVENGAQFGTFGNSSYALEGSYSSDNGQRPNNDFEQRTLSLQIKQQLTPQDSIYLQALNYYATGGDLLQRYYQTNANPGIRIKETQEPILLAGYHHEWGPGIHTLFLATWLNDSLSVNDPNQPALLAFKLNGVITAVSPFAIQRDYESTLDIYTTEIQQIWQQPKHNTVLGARFQTGEFHTQSLLTLDTTRTSEILDAFFRPDVEMHPPPHLRVASQDLTSGFQRFGFYGYHYWTIGSLQLIGGLAYDHVTFPQNFRFAPITKAEDTIDQVSPKAGVLWTPAKQTTVRAAYSRSLGGASFDQSFRLEPSQVAGLNQAFRSIIPEAVAAANAGADFETYGFSVEQKFRTGTYLGISGEVLNSDVKRTIGTFQSINTRLATPSGMRQDLDYKEKSLLFTFNQLLGEEWSLGVRYRISQADLEQRFPEIPNDVMILPENSGFRANQQTSASLHQLALHTIYNHRSGFFAQFQALWNQQSNQGYTPDIPGDDFWQLNAFLGYRFPRRKAEVMVGLLNITDRDYRLNPLNLYTELPHERTLMARLRFSF